MSAIELRHWPHLPVQGEAELGLQRYCPRCECWWPLDAEFWRIRGPRAVECLACYRMWKARAMRRVRSISQGQDSTFVRSARTMTA